MSAEEVNHRQENDCDQVRKTFILNEKSKLFVNSLNPNPLLSQSFIPRYISPSSAPSKVNTVDPIFSSQDSNASPTENGKSMAEQGGEQRGEKVLNEGAKEMGQNKKVLSLEELTNIVRTMQSILVNLDRQGIEQVIQ